MKVCQEVLWYPHLWIIHTLTIAKSSLRIADLNAKEKPQQPHKVQRTFKVTSKVTIKTTLQTMNETEHDYTRQTLQATHYSGVLSRTGEETMYMQYFPQKNMITKS